VTTANFYSISSTQEGMMENVTDIGLFAFLYIGVYMYSCRDCGTMVIGHKAQYTLDFFKYFL